MTSPITVHTFNTPNGVKITIALEELHLPYTIKIVNITKDEQFHPDFLKISPNNKIPAIQDPDGLNGQNTSVFESGAILLYLAEKTGKLLPQNPAQKLKTSEWLFWQVASLGPMLGQAHHFNIYAPEKVPYAVSRYSQEAGRLYNVLNTRLAESEYLGGNDYSIADIAAWPWTRYPDRQGVDAGKLKHFQRWFNAVAERPAVKLGQQKLADAMPQE
ncbi:MAG: glutathione S-transferase N-terminal domain-containing protein [Alphaproteobacteria bacterium]|nr:glutathione S-transferase N-terminal domain-containing protein [Alphaproteobacteria bacterium]